MIGNATTVDANVERVLDIIEAIVPAQSPGAGKFRRYRGEGDGAFIPWAEANPESAFRRVDAQDVGGFGVPVGVNDYEEREQKITVTVAYPNNARAGTDQTRARNALIGSDLDQLEKAIGLYSRANFSAPNPEACFRGWDSQRVAQAACTYLVVDVIYAFNRALT